ncbi:MAG: TolC family protein [Spirochaetaceae bacterium]
MKHLSRNALGVRGLRRYRRLLLSLSIALAVPAALGAETYAWTLSEALTAARRHDPELRRRALDVVETRGEAESSWNLFLPDLELGSSLSRSMFVEEPAEPWSAEISASASLAFSPALDQRIRGRSRAYEAALLAARRADVDLVRSVRERFYTLLLNERRIGIARRNVALAEEQLERVRELYERGRASELELLDARAAAVGRRPDLLSQRQALRSERAALKELTGLAPGDEIELRGRITLPELDLGAAEIEETVLSASLDMRAAELAVEQREIAEAITRRSTKLPGISAGYSYAPRISPAFDGAAWSEPESRRTGSVSIRLTVPLDPLIPRSAGDNEVRAARLATERARIDLEERRAGLRRSAAGLAEELALSRERLGILEEALEIAQARYEQTRLVYESGGVDLLDVENARADLEDTELDMLQERYNTVMALVELDALAGGGILSENGE